MMQSGLRSWNLHVEPERHHIFLAVCVWKLHIFLANWCLNFDPFSPLRPLCLAQIPGLEQKCDAKPISKKVEEWCHLVLLDPLLRTVPYISFWHLQARWSKVTEPARSYWLSFACVLPLRRAVLLSLTSDNARSHFETCTRIHWLARKAIDFNIYNAADAMNTWSSCPSAHRGQDNLVSWSRILGVGNGSFQQVFGYSFWNACFLLVPDHVRAFVLSRASRCGHIVGHLIRPVSLLRLLRPWNVLKWLMSHAFCFSMWFKLLFCLLN